MSDRTISRSSYSSGPADRLWELWRRGQRPDVATFLASVGPLPPAEVAAVLRVDQRERWRAGERVPAESYFEQFPDLEAEPESAVDLVYNEFLQREKLGERPTLDEYVSRFPRQAALLRQQIELHQALAGSVGDARSLTQDAGPATEHLTGPPELGEYEILGELGRGGMGVVLRGRDPHLGRELAIKILPEYGRHDPELTRRFLAEARITGQLQHPGVVPVYALETPEGGSPYFTMKLVQGQTLAALLARRPDPLDDLPRFVHLFEQVCQTLAYAHAHGVIHRDLKPANIMVGSFGEVQVMDWGLAKVLEPASGGREPPDSAAESGGSRPPLAANAAATLDGAVLGTPAYMAPEQANGATDRLDERCDVFSLGAVLCEILTGRPPFVGTGRFEVLMKAQQGNLAEARARLDGCGADAELTALARACLSASPDDRPRDAGRVADAVRGHLTGVQERLRRAEVERAAALVRADEERKRRRLTAALAAAGLLLLSALGGGAWWLQQERAEREAEHAARRSATERDVTAALRETAALLEQGRSQADDPERWAATLRVAHSALERGEGVLASGASDEDLRRQLAALRADLEQAGRDQHLVAELDRIRLGQSEGPDGGWAVRSTGERYADLLRANGLDVDGQEPDAVAGLLNGHPLRALLLDTLDDWLTWEPDKARGQRLREVLRAADPGADAFRNRWRDAWARRDRDALIELAKDVDVAAQPASTLAFLARSLGGGGALDDQERLFRAALERFPGDFWLNFGLAYNLAVRKPPRTEEALRYLTAALALRPRSVPVHINLGNLHRNTGDLAAAARCYRKAIELNPRFAEAHANLGFVLRRQNDLDGAIRCLREAVALAPNFTNAQVTLAMALGEKGELPEAVDAWKRVVETNPRSASAAVSLSTALVALGDVPGAVRVLEAAAERQLRDPRLAYSLGLLHLTCGAKEAALRSFRDAVSLDNGYAVAYATLGQALLETGQLAESCQAFGRALERLPADGGSRKLAEQQLRHAEQLLAAADKLPAFLDGTARPADVSEQLRLAWLCRYKQHDTAAVGAFAAVFADRPGLADEPFTQPRFHAACAAVRAAATADEPEPARLRRLALEWLRADLAMWSRVLEKAPPGQRQSLRRGLLRYRFDVDLAGLREAAALAKLPAEEGQALRRFWREFDDLIERAGAR